MLSIFWWYVTQFLHNIYIVFVISGICSLNTPTTWLYVFCSMPWHMSSPDTISILTVYNGIPRLGIMIPDMIMFDCKCIIIVRRDALSQSILSYGNYTSWRSRLYLYFRSPLSEIWFVHIWFFASIEPTTSGLTVLRSDQLSYFYIVSDAIICHPNSCLTTCFNYPATEVGKNWRGCLRK